MVLWIHVHFEIVAKHCSVIMRFQHRKCAIAFLQCFNHVYLTLNTVLAMVRPLNLIILTVIKLLGATLR